MQHGKGSGRHSVTTSKLNNTFRPAFKTKFCISNLPFCKYKKFRRLNKFCCEGTTALTEIFVTVFDIFNKMRNAF